MTGGAGRDGRDGVEGSGGSGFSEGAGGVVHADPDAAMTPRQRMLAALGRRPVDRVPVWFMRQAGRYLPEYQTIRQAHTFDERLRDPDLAARITLQPMQRFPLDAAILFSDILVPFGPMGHPAHFAGGGPVIDRPVRSADDVQALAAVDPATDLSFVGEAMRRVRAALPEHAVLGFAGAPFTLACYLIEGKGGKGGFPEAKRFAYQEPDAWHELLARLATVAGDHLAYQASCGADAVQLFDTWAEVLSLEEYEELVRPHSEAAIRRVRQQTDAPVIHFAKGTAHLLDALDVGQDCTGIDWRVDLDEARERHPRTAWQGNLDPTILFAPPERVRAETRRVLAAGGGEGHVFNLGHGVHPGTPIGGVQAMVEEVAKWRP